MTLSLCARRMADVVETTAARVTLLTGQSDGVNSMSRWARFVYC